MPQYNKQPKLDDSLQGLARRIAALEQKVYSAVAGTQLAKVILTSGSYTWNDGGSPAIHIWNASASITFTAPLSGAVTVWLAALASTVSNTGYQGWGLRDHTVTTTFYGPFLDAINAYSLSAGQTLGAYVVLPFEVTGLTPGTSYTMDWVVTNYGQSSTISAGYTSGGLDRGGGEPAVMKVIAA